MAYANVKSNNDYWWQTIMHLWWFYHNFENCIGCV